MTETEFAKLARSAGPRPTDAEIDAYGLTHAGKVRRENQDHFLIAQVRRQLQVQLTSLSDVALPTQSERLAFVALVADGVGGQAAGEEASRLAVEAVTRYVAESVEVYFRADPDDDHAFSRALTEAALRGHKDLARHAKAVGQKMATTLTLLLGVWPRAYILQVGDSRYYLLRHGRLTQVSRDQTIAQDLVDQGVFSRTEAARTSWANVLSSAIGGNEAAPVVTRVDLDRRDVHLLCSDGLTRHVPDERIAERLRTMTSARQACEGLLQDALDGGGTDNVTIFVGRALPPGTRASSE